MLTLTNILPLADATDVSPATQIIFQLVREGGDPALIEDDVTVTISVDGGAPETVWDVSEPLLGWTGSLVTDALTTNICLFSPTGFAKDTVITVAVVSLTPALTTDFDFSIEESEPLIEEGDLSALELAVLTPFTNYSLETFRRILLKHILVDEDNVLAARAILQRSYFEELNSIFLPIIEPPLDLWRVEIPTEDAVTVIDQLMHYWFVVRPTLTALQTAGVPKEYIDLFNSFLDNSNPSYRLACMCGMLYYAVQLRIDGYLV